MQFVDSLFSCIVQVSPDALDDKRHLRPISAQHPEPNIRLSPALATPQLGQGHLSVKIGKKILSLYDIETKEQCPQQRKIQCELCSCSAVMLGSYC